MSIRTINIVREKCSLSLLQSRCHVLSVDFVCESNILLFRDLWILLCQCGSRTFLLGATDGVTD